MAALRDELSAALGLLAAERHARGTGAGDEFVFLIRHVAFHQADRSAFLHYARRSAQPGLPHRAKVIDLQLDSGECLALFKPRGVSKAHGGVGDIAEHAAVQRAHWIPVALVHVHLEYRFALLRGDQPEAEQARNGRGPRCPGNNLLEDGERFGHWFTRCINWGLYRPPTAAPCGAAAAMRARSCCESETPMAPAFSSRYLRRLVPGMGTMSSPWASSQARASCPGVQPFSPAICSILLTRSRFFWKFSPWN